MESLEKLGETKHSLEEEPVVVPEVVPPFSCVQCRCPPHLREACRGGVAAPAPKDGDAASAFFFFIFKKIKISKIYIRFEKFRKWPQSPAPGATGVLSPKQQTTGA